MKYFKPEEFKCDGEIVFGKMDEKLLNVLDELRARVGIPLVIISSYRTEKHNTEVDGEKNSAHLRGKAVDIKVYSGRTKFLIITSALALGIRRIGVGSTFIHIDNDDSLPQDVIWTY